jgi:hypothetical protein
LGLPVASSMLRQRPSGVFCANAVSGSRQSMVNSANDLRIMLSIVVAECLK